MKTIQILFAALFLLAGCALAQDETAPPATKPRQMFFVQKPGGEGDVYFFGAEMMGSHEMVKGAPYTAATSVETTQVLGDGNRIVNKRSGSVARDSEGRLRREETMAVGPMQVNGANMIFIHDPVSQTAYVLNPDTQTGHVMKHDAPGMKAMEKMHAQMMEDHGFGGREGKRQETGQLKKESLGTQQIEGVNAEGTRITRTIPAGTIGNEKAIDIVNEIWTSPDLHTVVLKKTSDPRFGETVFRLTNIKRGEPDPSLFTVPAGFTIKNGPAPLVPPPPPGD